MVRLVNLTSVTQCSGRTSVVMLRSSLHNNVTVTQDTTGCEDQRADMVTNHGADKARGMTGPGNPHMRAGRKVA